MVIRSTRGRHGQLRQQLPQQPGHGRLPDRDRPGDADHERRGASPQPEEPVAVGEEEVLFGFYRVSLLALAIRNPTKGAQ
ncbi:MAG: hypothetical protein QM784_32740, partial [Polyangiaceae bacterium]